MLTAEAMHGAEITDTAHSAADFVDSIGVCTHWSYPDTPYGFAYEKVKQRLLDSGIRHVRDNFNDRLVDLGKAGIHVTLLVEPDNGSPAQICERIKKLNAEGARIEAIEGPNEPDLFWVNNHKSYQGKGFPEGMLAFQKDLYAALKGDPATAKLPVIGPSLGKTYDPGGGFFNPFGKGALADIVDYGNFHPYPGGNPFSVPFPYGGIEKYYWHGNFPSGNLDEFPYAFNTYRPPFGTKPMVATETGYSTDQPGGTSEGAHEKYLPRLYAEYFRLGVTRTFSYEFVNEFDKRGDREANFGLLRHDLTPKPAYDAVRNVIELLAEPVMATAFKPGALSYTLEVKPVGGYDKVQFVHHLGLQKRDGTFYLLLWHEIANEDTSVTPHRQLNCPAIPVTLKMNVAVNVDNPRVEVYYANQPVKVPTAVYPMKRASRGPMPTVSPYQSYLPSVERQIQLQVPDRVMILKFKL